MFNFETYLLILGLLYAYLLPIAAIVVIGEKLLDKFLKNKGG